MVKKINSQTESIEVPAAIVREVKFFINLLQTGEISSLSVSPIPLRLAATKLSFVFLKENGLSWRSRCGSLKNTISIQTM